jgi:hypothetical protein
MAASGALAQGLHPDHRGDPLPAGGQTPARHLTSGHGPRHRAGPSEDRAGVGPAAEAGGPKDSVQVIKFDPRPFWEDPRPF